MNLKVLASEPVRVYIYGLSAAVVAALIFYGLLSANSFPIIMALVLAALAMPSPVEAARNRVTPVPPDEGSH